jgi:hypothetical protein
MLLANKLIGFQFSFGQVAEDTFIALLSFAFFNQKKKNDCRLCWWFFDFSNFQFVRVIWRSKNRPRFYCTYVKTFSSLSLMVLQYFKIIVLISYTLLSSVSFLCVSDNDVIRRKELIYWLVRRYYYTITPHILSITCYVLSMMIHSFRI